MFDMCHPPEMARMVIRHVTWYSYWKYRRLDILVTMAVHHARREAEMQHDLNSSIIFLEILCEAHELALKLREMHPRREANSKVRILNSRHENRIIDFDVSLYQRCFGLLVCLLLMSCSWLTVCQIGIWGGG